MDDFDEYNDWEPLSDLDAWEEEQVFQDECADRDDYEGWE
jgi:hypothetical protein